MESNLRSLAKAVSWRISGTIATVVTVFLFTGEMRLAAEIGAVEFFIKILLFYMHERIWNFFPSGRLKNAELKNAT